MKTLLFILFIIQVFSFSAYSKTVNGLIDKENNHWKYSDSPIVVSGNIEIPDNITLTIDPGIIVKFDGYYRILVKGILEANGLPGKMITFTSNMEKQAVDDWEGIVFYGEKSGGYISYCKIKFAFKNLLWKSSPIIKNCYFSSNSYSIYCSFSKTAKILNNNFTNNNFGIYCDFSSPIIQKNNISNNSYGVYCILSSAPIIGENKIVSNTEKNIYMDDSMGKNEAENVNNHVWELMKGLF